MSSPWHEQYEEQFRSSNPQWTLQETFIGVVQAAFKRHCVQPADFQIDEVWLKIQHDHNFGKPSFESPSKLSAYIHRIASNIAIDIQRKRASETKRKSMELVHEQVDLDPTKSSLLTVDRILTLSGMIETKLSEVVLPQAIEQLRLKLKTFGEPPANETPGDETSSLPLGLTPERIEMRVKMLHWYGSEETLLVYFLYLHRYRGVQIARILGLSTPKVSILLKRAKTLFEKAKETILIQHADTLL